MAQTSLLDTDDSAGDRQARFDLRQTPRRRLASGSPIDGFGVGTSLVASAHGASCSLIKNSETP